MEIAYVVTKSTLVIRDQGRIERFSHDIYEVYEKNGTLSLETPSLPSRTGAGSRVSRLSDHPINATTASQPLSVLLLWVCFNFHLLSPNLPLAQVGNVEHTSFLQISSSPRSSVPCRWYKMLFHLLSVLASNLRASLRVLSWC